MPLRHQPAVDGGRQAGQLAFPERTLSLLVAQADFDRRTRRGALCLAQAPAPDDQQGQQIEPAAPEGPQDTRAPRCLSLQPGAADGAAGQAEIKDRFSSGCKRGEGGEPELRAGAVPPELESEPVQAQLLALGQFLFPFSRDQEVTKPGRRVDRVVEVPQRELLPEAEARLPGTLAAACPLGTPAAQLMTEERTSQPPPDAPGGGRRGRAQRLIRGPLHELPLGEQQELTNLIQQYKARFFPSFYPEELLHGLLGSLYQKARNQEAEPIEELKFIKQAEMNLPASLLSKFKHQFTVLAESLNARMKREGFFSLTETELEALLGLLSSLPEALPESCYQEADTTKAEVMQDLRPRLLEFLGVSLPSSAPVPAPATPPQARAPPRLSFCCNPSCVYSQKVVVGEVKFNSCGACRAVFYCGKACQKAHWPVHKKDCGDLAAMSSIKKKLSKKGGKTRRLVEDALDNKKAGAACIYFGTKEDLLALSQNSRSLFVALRKSLALEEARDETPAPATLRVTFVHPPEKLPTSAGPASRPIKGVTLIAPRRDGLDHNAVISFRL